MARTIAKKPLKKNCLLLKVLYVNSGRNLGYVFTKKLLEGIYCCGDGIALWLGH